MKLGKFTNERHAEVKRISFRSSRSLCITLQLSHLIKLLQPDVSEEAEKKKILSDSIFSDSLSAYTHDTVGAAGNTRKKTLKTLG